MKIRPSRHTIPIFHPGAGAGAGGGWNLLQPDRTMRRMNDTRQHSTATSGSAKDWDITPREVANLLKTRRNDFLLIDCRTGDEWDVGHVDGATLVPMQELSLRLSDLREHEDKMIVVMCRSGQRSCTVATVLRAEGFSNVRYMTGGIVRWIADVDSSLRV